jgi:hypothetical protein
VADAVHFDDDVVHFAVAAELELADYVANNQAVAAMLQTMS